MNANAGANWTVERVIGVIRVLAAEDEVPNRLETATITGDDTAETLGLDSIGAFSLVDRLESEIGVPLPDDFLGLGDSVSTIAERLSQKAAAGG